MKRLAFSILSVVTLSVCLALGTAAYASSGGSASVAAESSATSTDAPASPSAPAPTRSAASNNSLWESANAAYYEGNFQRAVALYDSIEMSGMVSAKLYYNKAGALFKMGRVGESILYYSRAERLDPTDGDIAHNLAIASTYTRNRIEPVPEFFITRWRRSLGGLLGGNGWAWLSLAMLACTLAGALLYMLPLRRSWRKRGFYGGVAAFALLAVSFSFALADHRETVSPTGGIVASPSAAVKSSPDAAGTDLFLLYEGDRVRLLDEMNGWSEITVANGSRGWIRTNAIAKID